MLNNYQNQIKNCINLLEVITLNNPNLNCKISKFMNNKINKIFLNINKNFYSLLKYKINIK